MFGAEWGRGALARNPSNAKWVPVPLFPFPFALRARCVILILKRISQMSPHLHVFRGSDKYQRELLHSGYFFRES